MAADDTTRIAYDLLLVGGSTSNLTLAHRLVQLAKASGQKLSIAILEKGRDFGSNIVSGAVTPTTVVQKLFPDWKENGFPYEAICNNSHFSLMGSHKKWDVPGFALPKELDKTGYLVLTLSQVVYWMANHLKEVVKDVPNVIIDFFPGFSAHDILYEGDRVVGTRVSHSENPIDDYIYADVTVFGDKGFISQDLVKKFNLSKNPQLWSVGIKETWEVKGDYAGKVWHTLGYPVLDGTFGGGFVYGLKNNRLTIGLVVSLDSKNPNLNPQQQLQQYKQHPWIQSMIEGGTLIKYGAALLPEGGYYSLPEDYAVDGAMLLGDALGTLNVMNLAGISMAMEGGYQAAEVLHEAFAKRDTSKAHLNTFKAKLENTFVIKELKKSRYFRYAFLSNPKLLGEYLPKITSAIDATGMPWTGFMAVGLSNPMGSIADALKMKQCMDGNMDIGPISYKKTWEDYDVDFKPVSMDVPAPKEKGTIYSREDAVFYAYTKYHEGNEHIDEFSPNTCVTCIGKYESHGKQTPCVADCTAEVHRIDIRNGLKEHGMSLENCIQCRTCEIVCPEQNLRVKPTYQGSGPDFMGL